MLRAVRRLDPTALDVTAATAAGTTAFGSTAAYSVGAVETTNKAAVAANSACGARHRHACQLLSAAGGRTRGRQSRADIAQASGRGREFTRRQKPLGRDGHLGCAWSWLLWRALSLKTKSMTPCLWAVAPAVAWVCSSGGGGTMASHAAGGDAKAGSVPGQGQAHLKIATGVATGGVEWAFE
jgi:hypothetical protein